MNDEDILIRLQIVEAVCAAARGNESIAEYNMVQLCENLHRWVTQR